eukprot:GABW01000268.1.p1 GENE.GABW01000268.1~~GABW01000268.1.p1  ORF type:complete len:104 (-),score=24.58 GABW01000268.1:3-314(-)
MASSVVLKAKSDRVTKSQTEPVSAVKSILSDFITKTKASFSWFFVVLCIAEVSIGWCRDGVLTWYVPYMVDGWGVSTDSVIFNVASGGVTILGMVGGMLAHST